MLLLLFNPRGMILPPVKLVITDAGGWKLVTTDGSSWAITVTDTV